MKSIRFFLIIIPIMCSSSARNEPTVVTQGIVTHSYWRTYTPDPAIAAFGVKECRSSRRATASAAIADCATALPWTGGTLDVRGMHGLQAWSSDALGRTTKPLDFLCSGVIFKVSVSSTIPQNVHLMLGEGCVFSLESGIKLTINGPMDGSSLSQHFSCVNGENCVSFGNTTTPPNIMTVYPQWWGASNNCTSPTQTTAAINAALSAGTVQVWPKLYQSSKTGSAGLRVMLGPGMFCINAPLKIGTQSYIFYSYWLEGVSKYGTTLMWVGGSSNDIITVGQSPNLNSLYIQHLRLTNKTISGDDFTALRAKQINGIHFEYSPSGSTMGGGISNAIINDVRFELLDNGIFANLRSFTDAVTYLKIMDCDFFGIYNQTNPVINPATDPVVLGHGNAFFCNCAPQNIYMWHNNFLDVQGYDFYDADTGGADGLFFDNNFDDADQMGNHVVIGLTAFTRLEILNNELQDNSSRGPILDIGTSGLGASNVSGGKIAGNYFTGAQNALHAPVVRVNYANGLVIEDNNFFSAGGDAGTYAISLTSNSTNVTIGRHDWVNWNKDLLLQVPESGSGGLIINDPIVGLNYVKMSISGEDTTILLPLQQELQYLKMQMRSLVDRNAVLKRQNAELQNKLRKLNQSKGLSSSKRQLDQPSH